MVTQKLVIDVPGHSVPALLWNPGHSRVILAVHGLMSNKEDTVIRFLAEEAERKGRSVLSCDLPEHGGRTDEKRLVPWDTVPEILGAYLYAMKSVETVDLFACSIGAYMSIQALSGKTLGKCLFLSPMVDMEFTIESMMRSAGVTEERLAREGVIPVPGNPPLDWRYLCYVREHPVDWTHTTCVLWGRADFLVPEAVIDTFAARTGADVTKADSEHFFHTETQLDWYRAWLRKNL